MSDIILPGGLDPKNTDIILPDGSVHTVEPEPSREPTPWEIMQTEIRLSGSMLGHYYRGQKHIVHATLVESLALRDWSQRL